LTLLVLILIQVLAMAQYTGGSGRGDFKLDYVYPVVVSNAHAGSNGSYVSLKLAFDAINAQVQAGFNVTVTLVDNTTETASAVLNAVLWTTLSIYPTVTGLSITGNLAAPLIDLSGADYVTIDGRVNATGSAKDLVITNTSTSSDAGTSTIRFINDACNDTVKYCTIKGSEMVPNTETTGSGIIFFSTGASTGNDGNVIINNNITNAADANRPIGAIFSLGTSSMENSGNTISSNNIYDFLNRGYASAGIILWNYSTGWTISGNSFYETATFTTVSLISPRYYYVVYINSGAGHTISSNNIGGSGAGSSGTWTKTGNFADHFMGIYVGSGSTGTPGEIQGNIIRNISWTSSSAIFGGLQVAGSAAANIGTTSGNVIGAATGNGSISFTQNISESSGGFYGMSASTTGSVFIQNNTVGAITTNNANTGYPANFFGIHSSGTGERVININTIGSTAAETTNSIYASSTSTTAAQTVHGIYSEGTGNTMIIANTVSKLTNGTTNTNIIISGLINGITTTDGVNTISGNTVRDLTIANANFSPYGNNTVTGICQASTSAGQTVSGNVIYNLTNTYASSWGTVCGLYYRGGTGGTNVVSGNFIHSLSFTHINFPSSIHGIHCQQGSATFYNNIIALGQNLDGDLSISGIYEMCEESNNTSFYFNTVYLYGAAGNGDRLTSAFYSNSATNQKNIRNNLFVNNRTGSTANNQAAITLWGTSGLTIDYNDYYAPNTGGVLGVIASINYSTLAAWQGITGQDAHSINVDPSFTSAGSATASDYMPVNTQLKSGVTISGITTDYGGITTRSSSPTMGAWEMPTMAPSEQATSVIISEIGSNRMKIEWTRGDGNGCAVFVKQTDAGTAAPVDNTTYSGNTLFPTGDQIGTTGWYCVYNGTGTSVTVNGLSASTGYRVHVCEYNNGSTYYNTGSSTGNPANQTTNSALAAIASVVDHVGCYGGSSGSVTATVSGGLTPYTYLWSNNGTTSTVSNLTAGTYWVTVTDAASATSSSSATVTQPLAALEATASVVMHVDCHGNSNGSVTATASGGTMNYSYTWSTDPVQNTQSATGLTAGIYWVTVTDAHSCTATSSATVTQPLAALEATASVVMHVDCHGNSNGSVTTSVSGGTTNYSYTWSTNPVQNTQAATGLTAGIYYVTVTDAHSCTATSSATVTQSPQWWPTVTGSTPICKSVTGTYTTETGMTNYIWTVSAGGSITSGGTSTDNTVTVLWNSSGTQTVSVNYTTPAGCTAVEAGVKPVTVHPVPTPVISGATVVPDGTTVEYSTPYVAGHTYSWSFNIGNVQYCDNTRTCMRVKWYNPCGLIGPGVVQVTETDPVTGCSTTATVYVTFTP
jgi:hypothetical protein